MKIAIKIAQQRNGVYRAWCPALPGCVVHGKSEQEMKPKIVEAVGGYLASFDAALPRELDRMISLMPEDSS